MDTERWAKDILDRVHEKYGKIWPLGMRIFYSSIHVNPPLMIISYQPGGSAREERDFSLDNSFLEDGYPFAKRIKDLLEWGDLLEGSIVIPAIFFRSPSVAFWKKEAGSLRKEMEAFSIEETRKIIETLNPQRLLIIGFATYDLLQKILEPIEEVDVLVSRREGRDRLALPFLSKGRRGIVVIHPTGARISKEDRSRIKDFIEHKFKP